MKPHTHHAPGLANGKLDAMIASRRARIARELSSKGGSKK